MKHTKGHVQGFADENGDIFQAAVFNNCADYELIEQLKIFINATQVINSCDVGELSVGFSWVNNRLRVPKPISTWVYDENLNAWIPPVPKPDSGFWKWNEGEQSWQETPLGTP